MEESPDMRNLKGMIKRVYIMSASYLADHPSILEFISVHRDLNARKLSELIEEQLSSAAPPRSTDLRIFKNALEKELTSIL